MQFDKEKVNFYTTSYGFPRQILCAMPLWKNNQYHYISDTKITLVVNKDREIDKWM